MNTSGLTDTLHLWYLGRPDRPVRIGEIRLVMSGRGVSLRYAPGWLEAGFPLSEDLPLIDREHLPREKNTAAGALDDARPDRWGERVIRLLERPPRLSLLELLRFAGDSRFGALGVSCSADIYAPDQKSALPELADLGALHEVVLKVLAGERITEDHRRLVAPGATMGGANPKALISIDGLEWVLKFSGTDTPFIPLIEHAAMTLASKAGITVATTRPVKLAQGYAVAVKRFDRQETSRLHAVSANVAFKAAGAEPGYPALAQLLRRRGPTQGGFNQRQMREVFRRLVFNILIDNTDDHEKNHALIVTDSQHYALSPAYDMLPTGQALGYQSMTVGHEGAVSSIDNALSMCQSYGLKRAEAVSEAHAVAHAVQHWRSHFKTQGVPAQAIDLLADQLDRDYLREQREALLKG